MAVMDEFKQQREAIKNGTPKEKMAYFWEYYKWYVIIPLIVILCVGNYIYHRITDPTEILNGILINAISTSDETESALSDGFLEYIEMDSANYAADFNTSLSLVSGENADSLNYETYQALMAWIGAGTVDFITADLETMTTLAYNGYFTDLSEILSSEEYALFEPYFLYIDEAVQEQISNAYDANLDTDDIVRPDCREPETMEKPVPVFIDISQCEALSPFYSSEDVAIGMVSSAPNQENFLKFLDYIIK